jgi:protein O-GlcNAc transferase
MLAPMSRPADVIAAHLEAAQQALAQGLLDAAEHAARAALSLAGDEVAVLSVLGQIQHRRGRSHEARDWFDRAVALAPDDPRLRANRAAARLGAGDAVGAEADADAALRADPGSFGAWLNLGLAREAQHRLLEAVAALERAHALRPDDVTATRALARCLYHSGTGHRRCRELLQALLARDPDDWMARLFLANSQVNDAEIEPALRDIERLMQAHPAFHQAHSTWLIAMQYDPRTTPGQLLQAHRDWARRHAAAASGPRPAATPRAGRALRIGWLSPRFGAGPMASFVLPVLEAIDPRCCEHVLYATHPPQGAFGERFRALANEWRTFSRESPEDVAERIRADRLDVLVDLAGHAPGNRLRALALVPAPVQVSWGDYFCTTGVPGIDGSSATSGSRPPARTPISPSAWCGCRWDAIATGRRNPCRSRCRVRPVRSSSAASTGRASSMMRCCGRGDESSPRCRTRASSYAPAASMMPRPGLSSSTARVVAGSIRSASTCTASRPMAS